MIKSYFEWYRESKFGIFVHDPCTHLRAHGGG